MVLMSMEACNAMTLQQVVDTAITKFEREAAVGMRFTDARGHLKN